jgi:hypothetical protein
MCAFASAEVLDQVKHQAVPENWRVFHAQAGYFAWNITVYLVAAFVPATTISASAFLFVTDRASALRDLWFLITFGGALGGAVIVLVWLAIRQIRWLRTVKEQVLVVTPDGFMAHTGGNLQNIFAVAFADLEALSLTVQPGRNGSRIFLHLSYNQNWHPRWYNWKIPPQYLALDVIAQTIIEAHIRYRLEHSNQE